MAYGRTLNDEFSSANAAQEMDASLRVESEGPGQGATFWLEFDSEPAEL